MPTITRLNGRSRPITDRQAQDRRSPQHQIDDARRPPLVVCQERHPAEGDRRVGQRDRQHLVDHAAPPAGSPAYRAPDQEADRDRDDRELVAADLRDQVVERRTHRTGDRAGAERARERRAAGAVAVRLPDRRRARLAERLPVHVEVGAGDRLVAAGAVASRRRAELRALELQIVHVVSTGTGTRAYRTPGATARSGR